MTTAARPEKKGQDIEFQKKILARPEEGIRVSRTNSTSSRIPTDNAVQNLFMEVYRRWLKWVLAVLLLIGMTLYFYFLYPVRGIGPQQPISFSHRVHAGVKAINCRFCHPYVERSVHAGLPEMEKCFYCHNYIIPSHPEILKEKGYLETGKPVPWVRIFYVPDFVKFRHEPHLRFGKLDCVQCHGDVKRMDRLQKKVFKMKFCIDCHREKKAQLDCWLACHH